MQHSLWFLFITWLVWMAFLWVTIKVCEPMIRDNGWMDEALQRKTMKQEAIVFFVLTAFVPVWRFFCWVVLIYAATTRKNQPKP